MGSAQSIVCALYKNSPLLLLLDGAFHTSLLADTYNVSLPVDYDLKNKQTAKLLMMT